MTPPDWTGEEWALVITAVATLIGVIVAQFAVLVRLRQEVHQQRATQSEMHTAVSETRAQMHTNGGSTVKDQLNRIEQAQRGMQKDIGRLADADAQVRIEADHVHERIHRRLDALNQEIKDMRKM